MYDDGLEFPLRHSHHLSTYLQFTTLAIGSPSDVLSTSEDPTKQGNEFFTFLTLLNSQELQNTLFNILIKHNNSNSLSIKTFKYSSHSVKKPIPSTCCFSSSFRQNKFTICNTFINTALIKAT